MTTVSDIDYIFIKNFKKKILLAQRYSLPDSVPRKPKKERLKDLCLERLIRNKQENLQATLNKVAMGVKMRVLTISRDNPEKNNDICQDLRQLHRKQ